MKGLANISGGGVTCRFMGMVGSDATAAEYRSQLAEQGVQPVLLVGSPPGCSRGPTVLVNTRNPKPTVLVNTRTNSFTLSPFTTILIPGHSPVSCENTHPNKHLKEAAWSLVAPAHIQLIYLPGEGLLTPCGY